MKADLPKILLMLLTCSLSSLLHAEAPIPVTVVTVEQEMLVETVNLPATAEALQLAPLSPRVSGHVQSVYIHEGEMVEAGQKILSLDRDMAELELASARALLAEAIARHKDALRLKREYESLISKKAVPTTTLASAIADEEAARAVIARERAHVRRQQEILERHDLFAPFSGMVANESVEIGQWVKQDAAIIDLVALDRIRVRAFLPQMYYSRVDLDSSVRVEFDALKGQAFTGTIASLVALGNQATRTFPLLIHLDNSRRLIAPGMSAQVFVQLASTASSALLLPRDAVVTRADGRRLVWKLTDAGSPSQIEGVTMKTGRTQGDRVEVLDSTLVAGDRVVLLGNENLRGGQTVKVIGDDG